jgi:signal transduction histidine kinase
MHKIIYFIVFLFSTGVYSQAPNVAVLDSLLNHQWTGLAKDWRYQRGDNMDWAKPEFDDASWPLLESFNLNLSDNGPVVGKNEIGWFRKRLKADSNLNDALVLNIYQTGASEIYLDGKRIHKLGVISTNPDEVVYHNPQNNLLSFPLHAKEQVLAVRFCNDEEKYPVYAGYNGAIRLLVTTLGNAYSKDPDKNGPIVNTKNIVNRYYITLGVSIFLCLLFSSFFFFFPSEKVNGYFALSSFFLALFVGFVIYSINTTGKTFWIQFFWSLFSTIQILLLLYCVYKIFNRPFGFFYWLILAVGFISIPLLFLIRPDVISPAIGVLAIFEIIRINILSVKTNKVGTFIFITFSGINILFWVGYLSNLFPGLSQYLPFAFMLTPVSLAIYLGYAFGARSQTLRLKLAEVEQLSKEKQYILSAQNETLEIQVKERTSALNQSLENLKSTQAQLIQSEKMASLGELTAGIAHEIQNPLNFVNNFSEVSNELIEEMKAEFKKGELDEGFAIADDIKQNLEKINHHGKRADAIVKGMLQHSRTSSGQKEPTDMNALCDEFLRLAYHGLKAKDPTFNVSFHFEADTTLPKVNVVPQDIGRVLLNLINNAFQAVNGYNEKPTVTVSTGKSDNYVGVVVKDNGPGVPEDIRDKIFQPFFTTKPTGEGTGLGLSLSYDIVKAHGGELKVETNAGEGSEFIVQIPIF